MEFFQKRSVWPAGSVARSTPKSIPQIKVPCQAWVGFSESFLEPLRLARCDARPDAVICFFEGVVTEDQAKALVDRGVFVAADAILYGDPFSDPRLIGYKVVDQEGRPLGTIASILRTIGAACLERQR